MATKQEKGVKFYPCGMRLLVRKTVADETTPGGIVLPESQRERGWMRRGEVLAVGPGEDGKKPHFDVGNVVHFTHGQDIGEEDERLVLVEASNICAIEGKPS